MSWIPGQGAYLVSWRIWEGNQSMFLTSMFYSLFLSLSLSLKGNEKVSSGEDKKMKKQGHIFIHLFWLVALFTITKRWKQPKCPLLCEWIKKYGIYIKCGILFSLRKEGNPDWYVLHKTWVNIEDIMLSELNHHKRTNSVWFHFYEVCSEIRQTQSTIVVSRTRGKGEWEVI